MKEGASLVVCGRKDDVGRALIAELRALGVQAEFICVGVRCDKEVSNLGQGCRRIRAARRCGQQRRYRGLAGRRDRPDRR